MTQAIKPLTADVGLEKQRISVEDLVEFTGFNIVDLAEMRGEGGVAAGADNAGLLRFCVQARARGLDPRKRQCFWIPRGGKWTFTTSIDGFSAMADRTQRFGGADAPEFRGVVSVKDGQRDLDVPMHAEVTVWKMVGPWEHPVTRPFRGTADWAEFYPGDGDVGRMWRKMPRRMLSKCALAQALRLAFPEQLADVELVDEGGPVVDVQEADVREVDDRDLVREPSERIWQRWLELVVDADDVGLSSPKLELPIERSELKRRGNELVTAISERQEQLDKEGAAEPVG
jgi:phage recombination protein Bet